MSSRSEDSQDLPLFCASLRYQPGSERLKNLTVVWFAALPGDVEIDVSGSVSSCCSPAAVRSRRILYPKRRYLMHLSGRSTFLPGYYALASSVTHAVNGAVAFSSTAPTSQIADDWFVVFAARWRLVRQRAHCVVTRIDCGTRQD